MRELTIRSGLVAAALLAGAFVAAAFAPSWPQVSGHAAGPWLRAVFAPLCHQRAERCLAPGGEPMAVCARCAGLYVGGWLGLAAGALLVRRAGGTPRAFWLAAAALPTAIDAVLPWFGLPQLDALARALLALPAGLAAGFFLAHGMADGLDMIGSALRRRVLRAAAVAGPEGNDG